MKKITLIGLLFASIIVFAQKPEVKVGIENKDDYFANDIRIIGEDGTAFYIIKSSEFSKSTGEPIYNKRSNTWTITGKPIYRNSMFIEKFSKSNLNQLFSKEIDFPKVNDKTLDCNNLLFVGKSLYLCLSSYHKK